MRKPLPVVERNERLSLLRPAWTQDDLHAYRHLHLRDRVIENHFVKTQGFRTMADLADSRRG